MVVFWVMLPEAAVIVTFWTPAGVPGVVGVVGGETTGIAAVFMELEQPTTRPVEAKKRTAIPSNRSFSVVRLREKASAEPKGRRKANAMTPVPIAQGPRCC